MDSYDCSLASLESRGAWEQNAGQQLLGAHWPTATMSSLKEGTAVPVTEETTEIQAGFKSRHRHRVKAEGMTLGLLSALGGARKQVSTV